MTFEIFSSLKSHIIRWPRHLLMAGSLCLLVACGGGGGGGSSPSGGTTAVPTIALTRSDGGASVYPGNTALVLPQFNYGTGALSWTDSSGAGHSQPVVAGTPVAVTPSQTTTYTLSVTYQDPTTVRTSLVTGSATLPVTVVSPPSLLASLSLSTAPTGTVTPSTAIQITPTFTVPAGLNLTSSVILVNADAASAIAATSGTPVVHRPTVDTTYTLKVCYTDTRVVPVAANCASVDATRIQVASGPTKFSTGGLLNIARSDFTATALQNGTVLIAGGINSTGVVEKSVEIYDMVNNKWIRTGDMKTARRGHAATLLSDGRVLITGGYDGTTAATALNKAETYDPATGVWTATKTTLIEARRWHTSTLLPSGKVLIAGGGVSSGNGTVTELFDPSSTATTSFVSAGTMAVARQGHTATLLPSGKVLIVGRSNSEHSNLNVGTTGAPINVDSARTSEIYDPAATAVAPATTPVYWSYGPTLNVGRDSHTATLVPNADSTKFYLLVAGGFGGSTTSELLDVTTSTLGTSFTAVTHAMSVSRALHTSTYISTIGKVLTIGGYNATSLMLMSTELFNLDESVATTSAIATNSPWVSTGSKELTLTRAMHTSTLLSNGNVLVLGTYYTTSGTVSNTTEIWSPP
jgi:Galactose oxidase, central domain